MIVLGERSRLIEVDCQIIGGIVTDDRQGRETIDLTILKAIAGNRVRAILEAVLERVQCFSRLEHTLVHIVLVRVVGELGSGGIGAIFTIRIVVHERKLRGGILGRVERLDRPADYLAAVIAGALRGEVREYDKVRTISDLHRFRLHAVIVVGVDHNAVTALCMERKAVEVLDLSSIEGEALDPFCLSAAGAALGVIQCQICRSIGILQEYAVKRDAPCIHGIYAVECECSCMPGGVTGS